MTDHWPVSFTPSQECAFCDRPTDWGVAEYSNASHKGAFMVDPFCPVHGYYEAAKYRTPTGDEHRWERESIVRFLIDHHGGKGKAGVIAECEVQDVPGFHPRTTPVGLEFGYYAWSCWYELEGQRQYGYTVFDIDEFEFTWHV
jgi:hypothetical protein